MGPNKLALGHKHLDPIYLDPVTSHLKLELESQSRTNLLWRVVGPLSSAGGIILETSYTHHPTR